MERDPLDYALIALAVHTYLTSRVSSLGSILQCIAADCTAGVQVYPLQCAGHIYHEMRLYFPLPSRALGLRLTLRPTVQLHSRSHGGEEG